MVKHYIWLSLLSAFGLWSSWQIAAWPLASQSLLLYMPYVMAGFGVFVALFLNRLRPILMILTLVLTVFALSGTSFEVRLSTLNALYPLITLLLPLNLLLWLFVAERGVKSIRYSLVLLSIMAAQVLGVWIVTTLPTELLSAISSPISEGGESFFKLPSFGSVMMILVANVVIIRLAMVRKQRVLDSVTLFVIVLMALGLNGISDYGVLAWLTSVSILMIILSMIFDAHQLAYTDELTGLPNRRALLEAFLGLRQNYSVAMVDIDRFKQFNDRYSEDIGDRVLVRVGRVLKRSAVGGGVYRFESGEFSVLFRGKIAEQLRPNLEELRRLVEETELKFDYEGEEIITKVTVSIGVASKDPSLKRLEAVIKAASQALYHAKELGRDRVAVYGDPVEQSLRKGERNARVRR